jgi:glycosyltransferase involved in cell wall biosynthesis
LPKVFYTDATFAGMLGYYPAFNNLSSETIRQGHKLEKQALDSCTLAVYSSDWAAQSAIKFYGTDPSKVKVVPFGANFDVHHSKDEVEAFIGSRDKNKLKILFNGVDWVRKGGDLVFSTVKELKRRGIDVELHIVGIRKMPFSVLPDYVRFHGFLNKSLPKQKELLQNLYTSCHFLFLPSKAEAFGCVFCEAALYGMPSITRKTGGLTTAINEGENGFALDYHADLNNYADVISENFLDYDKYIALAKSSYREYSTRLNWKTAGETLSGYLKNI